MSQMMQSMERVSYYQGAVQLADAHCHLDMLDDPKAAVNEAVANGVGIIITSGGSRKANEATTAIAKSLGVYGVVGIDPSFAVSDREYVDQSAGLIRKNMQLIGIGEIGLDASVLDRSGIGAQREVFARQIDIANELDIPAVIHSRGMIKEVIRLLDEHPANRAMFHFFEGDEAQARYLARKGHMISIPPRDDGRRKRVIKETDLSSMVAETDCPVAGRSPSDVKGVIASISSIKNIGFGEVAEQVSENVKGFFHI